jgi:prepilin-type processing-associated H-X9-DG protein
MNGKMSDMLRNLSPVRWAIIIVCILTVPLYFFMRAGLRANTAMYAGVSCAYKLKNVGRGMSQYAQDNDGMLPAVNRPELGATWKTDIMPYLQFRLAFSCPSRGSITNDNNGLPIGYAVNTAGVGRATGNRGPFAPSRKPINVNRFPNTAQVIAVCEVQNTSSPGFDIDDPFFGPKRQVLFAAYHGQTNVLYLDGHAKSLLPHETAHGSARYDLRPTNMWYIDGAKPLSANGAQILTETAFPK